MTRPPKFPTYDPAAGGNVFRWIISQAAVLREKQEAAAMQPRPRLDYLSGKRLPPEVITSCGADSYNQRSAEGTPHSRDAPSSVGADRKCGTDHA